MKLSVSMGVVLLTSKIAYVLLSNMGYVVNMSKGQRMVTQFYLQDLSAMQQSQESASFVPYQTNSMNNIEARLCYDTRVETESSSFHCNSSEASFSYTTQQVHAKIQQLCGTDEESMTSSTPTDFHYRCSELDVYPNVLSLDQIDESLPSYTQNLATSVLPSDSTTSSGMNIISDSSHSSLTEAASVSSYPVVVISPGKIHVITMQYYIPLIPRPCLKLNNS